MTSDSVFIIAPFPPGKIGGVSVQAEIFSSHIKNEGINVEKINTNISPLFANTILQKIIKSIKQPLIILFLLLTNISRCKKIIIFSTFSWGYMPVLISVIVGKFYNKKVIFSCHAGQPQLFLKKYLFLIRWNIKLIDKIIVPSNYLKYLLSSFYIDSIVVPNIINLTEFRYKKRVKPKRRILWLRHFCQAYNPFMAIKVAEQLIYKMPDIQFHFVGGGNLLSDCIAYIKEKQLDKNIKIMGPIDRNKMKEIEKEYHWASIYINTSNYDLFPIVFLESGATGLPIISTNSGGIPYILKDNINSLIVRKNDVNGMVEKILLLLNDEKLYQKLSIQIYNFTKNCSWSELKNRKMTQIFY